MTAFRAVVIEHFRRPRNRGPLADANGSAEGANPLCGDRIRVQVLVRDGAIVEARFTADACALCVAAASLLTEGARGRSLKETNSLDRGWLAAALEGAPPPGRSKCVALPLDTLHRAIASASGERTIAGLLLAAGGSRRFKSQKLVAPHRGVALVEHAAMRLRAATDRVIVVVGHDADAVRGVLSGFDLRIVENHEWEQGLSTSIRCGLKAMPDEIEAIVVAVGDQPGLDPGVIRSVIARWRDTGVPIVSASYRGERGHPVLFARSVFAELLELQGDAGARLLIERSPERVSYVDVDAAMPPDVDTSEQLAALEHPTSPLRP